MAKARGHLGTRKVGHSGTLDPDATGVLLLGVGKVTRLLQVPRLPPEARTGATVVLGTATSTLDASGEVTGRWDMASIGVDAVRGPGRATSPATILQMPPMVSAVQVDGQRLHALARQGIEVDRKPRPVTVHALHRRARPLAPGIVPDRGHLLLGHLHPRRWPPTSAPHSAAAPTSATCAAPRSARSRPTRPWPSRT